MRQARDEKAIAAEDCAHSKTFGLTQPSRRRLRFGLRLSPAALGRTGPAVRLAIAIGNSPSRKSAAGRTHSTRFA